MPAGLTMRRWWDGPAGGDTPGGLEIKRRWLRSKHFAFLAVALLLVAGVAHLWSSAFEPAGLRIAATVFASLFALRLVPMFTNSTTIRVLGDHIEVVHGPLPTLMFRNQSVSASQVSQLFAAKWGAVYEVGAELKDGSRLSLVRPLVSELQALFVEQVLEKELGIVDYEVGGELDAANLPGTPARVSSGLGGAIAVGPIVLIIAVVMFLSAFSSSTQGSFTLGGDLGDTTFTPDWCESGQLKGFHGVELTSDASPGLTVRAMQDPVRGTLLVVARGGGKPVVITPEECTSLHVRVERGNTNVNDVWAVGGSASADCPALKGTVTFDGCH